MTKRCAQFVVDLSYVDDGRVVDWEAVEKAFKSALIQSVIVDKVVRRETGCGRFDVDVTYETDFEHDEFQLGVVYRMSEDDSHEG